MNEYAIFILSHGRADAIRTVECLERFNYTGDWFVVIDDEDDQENRYRERFGEHIIQFNKKKIADETDTGDLDTDRRVGVFARNFIIDEADRRGYKYHLQLDDDFWQFSFRYVEDGKLQSQRCKNLDNLFGAFLDYLKSTPITWLSFGLSSDYLGGAENDNISKGMIRKTMGTFFMKAEDKVKFTMRMNDDITTCILEGSRGKLFYTIISVQVATYATQHISGGMTETYKENGTYRKSFYSVMSCPSFVKISAQGITDFRIHHEIKWNNAVPKLLNERWCKHAGH